MVGTRGQTVAKHRLQIIRILESKAYGTSGGKLLPVTVKDLSLPPVDPMCDKVIRMVVFASPLQEAIQKAGEGTDITADYLVKPREDRPDAAPDCSIVQVYGADGQPIQKKFTGGGFRGPSTEELNMQEDMKRAEIVGSLWNAGKLGETDNEVKNLRAWLGNWKTVGRSQGVTTEKGDKVDTIKAAPAKKLSSLGDLFNWSISHGKEFTPDWVRRMLNGFDLGDGTDAKKLVEAQRRIKNLQGWKD